APGRRSFPASSGAAGLASLASPSLPGPVVGIARPAAPPRLVGPNDRWRRAHGPGRSRRAPATRTLAENGSLGGATSLSALSEMTRWREVGRLRDGDPSHIAGFDVVGRLGEGG